MRKATLILALLIISTPVFAQTTSGASSSVNINNPPNTDSKTRFITTPSVVAPGLAAAGVETCLGSATGGVSVMGGGLTFGRTFPDEGCNIRLAARQLFAFGFQRAAIALMCQDPHVAAAMDVAGQPCPASPFGARRREKIAAEIPTEVTSFAEEERPVGHELTLHLPRPKRGKKTAAPQEVKISVWKNPDDFIGADTSEPTDPPPSQSEQRWFARMTPAY